MCFHVHWLLPDVSLSAFPVQDVHMQSVIYPRTISHQNLVSTCAVEHLTQRASGFRRQAGRSGLHGAEAPSGGPTFARFLLSESGAGALAFAPLVLPSHASLSARPGSRSATQGSVGVFPVPVKTHLCCSSLQLPGKTLLLSRHFEAKTQA